MCVYTITNTINQPSRMYSYGQRNGKLKITDWVSPMHVKNTNFCFKTPDPPPFKKLLNETDSLYFNKSDSNLNETNYLNETNFLNETLNGTPNGKLNKTLTDVFYNPISPILFPAETLSKL